MNKSVVQCCALFDRKCLFSFFESCFYMFVLYLLLLFCFVLNEWVSIYALISRDGFQQIIAKALVPNATTMCVRISHKKSYHLYYREVYLGHPMEVNSILETTNFCLWNGVVLTMPMVMFVWFVTSVFPKACFGAVWGCRFSCRMWRTGCFLGGCSSKVDEVPWDQSHLLVLHEKGSVSVWYMKGWLLTPEGTCMRKAGGSPHQACPLFALMPGEPRSWIWERPCVVCGLPSCSHFWRPSGQQGRRNGRRSHAPDTVEPKGTNVRTEG